MVYISLYIILSLLNGLLYITVICIPVQVIIIPLDCNRNIPNINFRSRITLAVNLWLLVHFLYLNINYSHYNAIALCYRLCCTMWMIVYCYPKQIHSIYHQYKRKLPDWIRPFLRIIRDNFIPKVWRNFRTIIERRRREETTIDSTSSQLQSMVPDYSSTFISRSDGNRLYGGMEIFMMEQPIQCTEFEFSSELD